MKFATTKRRIILYIDYKGISVSNFFIETGIKRGFLDSDKLDSAVSDVFIAKIIAVYKDLNLYWLITGKGEMLLEKNEQIFSFVNEPLPVYSLKEENSEVVEILKQTIADLKKEVEELKDDKEVLKSVIKIKLGKANAS